MKPLIFINQVRTWVKIGTKAYQVDITFQGEEPTKEDLIENDMVLCNFDGSTKDD